MRFRDCCSDVSSSHMWSTSIASDSSTTVVVFGEARGAHVDLAVDETLLVTVREPLCSDDAVARSFQMIDRPLRRIFAVGLFAREKQAGVAEAPDFPDEAARFGFGVAGHIGFQPDDIEPPSDERAQPREQPMLEIGREAVDRAEQIVDRKRT